MNLDKFKEIFAADWIPGAEFVSAAIDNLNLSVGASVLDIGTGYGASACLLALHGYDVVTGQPEHHPQWQEHNHSGEHDDRGKHESTTGWQENAAALGLSDKITFENFEAENLPHADEQFDAVFLFDSLHHIDDRRKAIEQALRVVKQEGVVCIIEWTLQHIQKAMTEDGITIGYIDPRAIIPLTNIEVDLQTGGEWYNIYLLRKRSG